MTPKKLIHILSSCALFLVILFPSVKMGSQDLDSTLKEVSLERDSSAQLKDLIQLSKEHLNTQPDVSLNYAKNALHLARSLKSEESEIDALYRVSAAYKDKGALDSAYYYNSQAKELCERIRDENRLADILLLRVSQGSLHLQLTLVLAYQWPEWFFSC